MNASKSGVVPGGGSAFATAANAIAEARPTDELGRFGFEAVRRALTRPLYWNVKNAGKEPTSVIEEIQTARPGIGFDAKIGQLCNLAESGVIDPTVNALAILQTSISTLRAMLNLATLINIEEDSMSAQEEDRMGIGGRMGVGGRRARRI
jgi:chaperonin GroEL